ncbi:hypothetical protein BCR39DRAFT_453828, partial [Naematelia encephala]
SILGSVPTNCPVANIKLSLPSGFAVPCGQTPELITVGSGVQNYTCTSGSWVTAGALASLYDVSCVFQELDRYISPTLISSLLPEIAYRTLPYPVPSGSGVDIEHSFINTSDGLEPRFVGDGREVIAERNASVSAPNADDIPWLELTAVNGTLAKTVFRIDTVRGQPPATCSNEGGLLSVQYAALYVFT